MNTFPITHQVIFPDNWPPNGVVTDEGNQRRTNLHSSPKPYSLRELPPNTRFAPTSGLHLGPGKWSQVYRGFLTVPELGPVDVVLKVYTWNFFPRTEPLPGSAPSPETHSGPNSDGHTEALLAWTESSAYKNMTRLQGEVVPKFYGAYLVKTTEGDDAHFGAAMSYIGGVSFLERCNALGSNTTHDIRWYPMALALLKGVYSLHQSGVCDLDVRNDNLRVVQTPDGSSEYLMFLDFAFSRPSWFQNKDQAEAYGVDVAIAHDSQEICALIHKANGWATLEEENRSWSFVQWVREEFGEETWVKEWASDLLEMLKPRKRNKGPRKPREP